MEDALFLGLAMTLTLAGKQGIGAECVFGPV